MFYGDYHTHTRYSDGAGSVEDNIKAAIGKGLKEIAITDHGKRNPFAMTHRKILKQRKEIELYRKKYPEIKILHGVEADLADLDGRIDLTEEEIEMLDIVIAGYHPVALPYGLKSICGITWKTYWADIFKPSNEMIARNTKLMIRMIERNPIDILPHINTQFFVDVKEVAKVCIDTDTYMELNEKHADPKVFELLFESGAKLISDTDAHFPSRVGSFDAAERFIKENNADVGRLVNAFGAPKFKKKRII
ncbi:MAG: PHP domain-containing protein [Clostridiales bacterium]|jgi:putative hydrolase|nr:PHP domain-containing protein [Clostridiales bacterium]